VLERRAETEHDRDHHEILPAVTEPTARLIVRLQPRASRTEVVGERAGAVLVRVTAPPVDGKANAALCELIADEVGVARSAVSVVRGETSRDKVVEILGVDLENARRALLADR
jgi:uncharacterized protein